MADLISTLDFSDEDYKKAAITYKKQLLTLPILSAQDTLKYMTPCAGLRAATKMGTIESHSQLAPHKSTRKAVTQTDVKFRTLPIHIGSTKEDFDPTAHLQELIGRHVASLGDATKEAPSAKLVLASMMKSIGYHLGMAAVIGERDDNGETTYDLLNGYSTIISNEINEGNISVAKKNLVTVDAEANVDNACDIAKYVEYTLDPNLRVQEKFFFCSPEFYDLYCESYKESHKGLVYNTTFNQPFLEGSGHKTTMVPLVGLSGSDTMWVTPKFNIFYGFDTMSDLTRLRVDRFDSFLLTIACLMFFGVEFQTIDYRYFKAVKLKEAPVITVPDALGFNKAAAPAPSAPANNEPGGGE